MNREAYLISNVKFQCVEECHKCCSGSPGIILVTEEEIETISDFLSIEKTEFIKTYIRIIKNYYSVNFGFIDRAYSLKENAENDCIFLKNGRCSIYPARPAQCKTYPFWPSIVSSQSSWKSEKTFCPGIGRGKIYTKEEIENTLNYLKSLDYSIKNA
ncbi:YkgJ family cysteine cluster protein [candidate division WOR-3 bacterium]|nr:YkgJ family cysteine cluster protein [candidate division WOR-3 bacterium]